MARAQQYRSKSLVAAGVLSAMLCCLSTGAWAQTQCYRLEGKVATGKLGETLAGVGDINGDGSDDFATTDDRKVVAYDGATAELLWTSDLYSQPPRVSAIGDVNQDGHADVLVSCPYCICFGRGALVLSGKTGAWLYLACSEDGSDEFGADASDAGDLNGDGVPDFVVGATGYYEFNRATGSVSACSGVDGTRLWTRYASPNTATGDNVAGVGDQDMDGYPDVVSGPPWGFPAVVCSGLTGDLIREIAPAEGVWQYVDDLAGLGDLDGDGIDEIGLGVTTSSLGGEGAGSVDVYAGGSDVLAFRLLGQKPSELFGYQVAGRRDLDGDGFPDIVASSYSCDFPVGCNLYPGVARAYSGADLSLIAEVQETDQLVQFGTALAMLGDVNGDGLSEFAVSAPYAKNAAGTYHAGRVDVFSAVSLPLTGDKVSLKLPTGGTQKLRIKAGAEHGGELFVLLGTSSGGAPGIELSGLHLPLNLDPYTNFALLPGASPLSPIFGVLDGAGKANATLTIPSGTPPVPFSGLSLHHIALLIDPASGALTLSTNNVPLSLTQ